MKPTNKFSRIISIALFGIVLLSAFLQQAFHVLPELPNNENRKLNDKPKLAINTLDSFPSKYESYYNDHFAFRNHFVKLYADISFDFYEKCPYPDQVLIGKNQNLFMVPREMDTYLRNNLFTQNELDKIKSEFIYRKKYCEEKGIDYYVAFSPTKYSIYPELLPWYIKPADTLSRTDQCINLLQSIGIQVIDLRIPLLAAKDSVPQELYTATDNHWNEIGAFIAYQDIMKRLIIKHTGLRMLKSSDYIIISQKREGGNMAHILNRQQEMPDVKYNFRPQFANNTTMIQPCPYPAPAEFDIKDYFNGYYMHKGNLPKILIVHDSFGKFIHPYFKDSFSRSIFIWDKWQYKLNETIVESEKPDIYITLTLESLLQGLADNCEFRK